MPNKLSEINRNSDAFRDIARRIASDINNTLCARGYTDDATEYEDTISSVAYDALEELLYRIIEIENRRT